MKKLIIIAALTSSPAFAEVYKCAKPDGGVLFQAGPCAGNIDAPPLIMPPSPAQQEKMAREAIRQKIADSERRLRQMQEEKHQAEMNAIMAREAHWDQLRASIMDSRIAAQQRHQQWVHDDYCRNRTHFSPHDGC